MAASTDRRRFHGPDLSYVPRPAPKAGPSTASSSQERSAELAAPGAKRADGRGVGELRPICACFQDLAFVACAAGTSLLVVLSAAWIAQLTRSVLQPGLVAQASGSAYIETGKAKVACAVYGPHPARANSTFSPKAKLNVEVRFTPFASADRRRTPGKDTESPRLSAQIQQALTPAIRRELYPKAAIDIFLTVIESDGPVNDLSLGVTAASVALAQAGIEMIGIVTACCGALVVREGHPPVLMLDPTAEEASIVASEGTGILSIACLPALGTVTNLDLSNSTGYPPELVKAAFDQLRDACTQIHGVASAAILDAAKAAAAGAVNGT